MMASREPVSSFARQQFLWLSGLATMVVVGLLAWPTLAPAVRGPALGLFALFGGLFALFSRWQGRWAGVIIALQSVSVALLVVLHGKVMPFAALWFMVAAEAALYAAGWALVAWVAFLFLITYAAVWFLTGEPAAVLDALLLTTGYGFFAAFASMLRQVEAARQRTQTLLADLEQAHQQLQAYMQQAEELAMERERNRMAQELHSSLGYRLGLIEIHLQSLQRWLPREAERDWLLAMDQVRAAQQEVHQVTIAYSEGVDDLPAALHRALEEFRAATGLQVQAEIDPTLSKLPRPVQLVLYSALREGLRNIQQHAHASQVVFMLRSDPHRVQFVLEDNGVGPAAEDVWQQEGQGLRAVAERAARWGGTLRLTRRRPQGARLVLTFTVEAWARAKVLSGGPSGDGERARPTPEGAGSA